MVIGSLGLGPPVKVSRWNGACTPTEPSRSCCWQSRQRLPRFGVSAESTPSIVDLQGDTVADLTPQDSKRVAWNRGLQMTDAVKLKISDSLKGRVPWNKGLKLSEKTRERIRLGRLGQRHSLATRRKMSVSHTGMTHSAETMKTLSRSLTGRKMTEEHKRKISASQKRRHAANRALKAIEEAHKTAGALYGKSPSCPSSTLTTYFHQSIDRKRHSREKKTRAEVLKMYKTILHEYRRLQEELSPWMRAFEMKNARKPCLADVDATQITWLVSNFKQYLLMRDKLLRDIPYLRTAMVTAPTPSPDAVADPSPLEASEESTGQTVESLTKMERMETVASSPLSSDRVKNAMTAALNYKKKQSPRLSSTSLPTPSPHLNPEISEVQAKAIAALKTLQRAQEDYDHLVEQSINCHVK